MTGLEAGPKMLSGFRCVHTLKKRMLIGSPLSAKRAIARNGSKHRLGVAF
jgi:hypothetical protein